MPILEVFEPVFFLREFDYWLPLNSLRSVKSSAIQPIFYKILSVILHLTKKKHKVYLGRSPQFFLLFATRHPTNSSHSFNWCTATTQFFWSLQICWIKGGPSSDPFHLRKLFIPKNEFPKWIPNWPTNQDWDCHLL